MDTIYHQIRNLIHVTVNPLSNIDVELAARSSISLPTPNFKELGTIAPRLL
jgi:hypothetical protein